MKPGGAFTLIEIIVVMVIVAIMAVVAVPAFSNSGSSRAAVAARMISRDLAYARERAIATGTKTWVVFSPGTNSYSVLAEDPANPGRANASPLNDPINNGKRYIGYLNTGELAGITMTGATFDSGTEIGFDWVGKPYNSSSTLLSAAGTVTLSAGGYTITVQPATGLAKVTP